MDEPPRQVSLGDGARLFAMTKPRFIAYVGWLCVKTVTDGGTVSDVRSFGYCSVEQRDLVYMGVEVALGKL